MANQDPLDDGMRRVDFASVFVDLLLKSSPSLSGHGMEDGLELRICYKEGVVGQPVGDGVSLWGLVLGWKTFCFDDTSFSTSQNK